MPFAVRDDGAETLETFGLGLAVEGRCDRVGEQTYLVVPPRPGRPVLSPAIAERPEPLVPDLITHVERARNTAQVRLPKDEQHTNRLGEVGRGCRHAVAVQLSAKGPIPWGVLQGIEDGIFFRRQLLRCQLHDVILGASTEFQAVAINYFAYNLIKIHRSLRMSPAMAAGVVDRLFDVSDLVNVLIEAESKQAA